MNTIKINSYAEFKDEIKYGKSVVYRGQSKDYNFLTPSLFRSKKNSNNQLDLGKLAEKSYISAYNIEELAKLEQDWIDSIYDNLNKKNEELIRELLEENWLPGDPYYLLDYDDWVLPSLGSLTYDKLPDSVHDKNSVYS
jgi:hypothetical protein